MGGKSRKTGGVSKKLIQRLVQGQKEQEQNKKKKGRKDNESSSKDKGFGLV